MSLPYQSLSAIWTVQVFTSMALFSILISPLNAFPWVINGLVEAWVSTKRVQAFLKLGELDWDQYYSDVHDVATDDSNGSNDRASFNKSPASDSLKDDEEEELRDGDLGTVIEVRADVTPPGGRHEDKGLAGVRRAVDLPQAKRGEEEEEEELYVGSVPSTGEMGEVCVRFQPTPEEGRSGRESRLKRKSRVIVVKNGTFTWTRKDGERVSGDSSEKMKEKGDVKDTTATEEKSSANSKEVVSVEWMLSDLSFTIYSVSTILSQSLVLSIHTYMCYYTVYILNITCVGSTCGCGW